MAEAVGRGLQERPRDHGNIGGQGQPRDLGPQVEVPARGSLALQEGQHGDPVSARFDIGCHLQQFGDAAAGDGRPPIHDRPVARHRTADDRDTRHLGGHPVAGDVGMFGRIDRDPESTGLAPWIESPSRGVDGGCPRGQETVVGGGYEGDPGRNALGTRTDADASSDRNRVTEAIHWLRRRPYALKTVGCTQLGEQVVPHQPRPDLIAEPLLQDRGMGCVLSNRTIGRPRRMAEGDGQFAVRGDGGGCVAANAQGQRRVTGETPHGRRQPLHPTARVDLAYCPIG
jgi:hypothetical protein